MESAAHMGDQGRGLEHWEGAEVVGQSSVLQVLGRRMNLSYLSVARLLLTKTVTRGLI